MVWICGGAYLTGGSAIETYDGGRLAVSQQVVVASVNYRLGLERATAVKDYLVSQGVSPDRIQTASGGKTNPVASNATAIGRARNRRVVIRKNVGQAGGPPPG